MIILVVDENIKYFLSNNLMIIHLATSKKALPKLTKKVLVFNFMALFVKESGFILGFVF